MVETTKAEDQQTIDGKSGYCSETRTYHSLRPPVSLPPLSQPLSITQFALDILHQSSTDAYLSTTPFLIDATTGHQLLYADFLQQTRSLSLSLRSHFPSLSNNNVAFILSPPALHVPILYFSLLSIGVVVSPANPLSSLTELTHLLQLTKPSLAFATSATAHKLPPSLPVILLDSPVFLDMLSVHAEKEKEGSITIPRDILTPLVSESESESKFAQPSGGAHPEMLTSSISSKSSQLSRNVKHVIINQLDSAAILYSSGTTGRVKGVQLTHRNLIAVIAGMYDSKYRKDDQLKGLDVDVDKAVDVSLFTLPLFHVFGFFMLIKAAAMGETLVLMGRFDFEKMLKAVEKYKVTYMPVSPPLVVAMAKSELVEKYDLSSLQLLGCGGAPLGKEVSERFKGRFPHVEIIQGYGLTETGGSATRMIGPEESTQYGSAGRLAENTEAKIVDPESGEALPPGQRGELWLRGPTIMKGYVGDDEATAATLDSEGWLRTGDLCYFDSDGFLFIVDRLKELIKYKAYQVPPAELEHLLQSIPEVADAAVIPYPDEEAGQIPMAYIVRRPGSNISETEVMDFITKQVAPYKKIRRVAFINSIPKSPAGKILRRELINHALSGASAKL